MIRRIALVAKREFVVTVSSKGFLIGLLIMPALAALFFTLVPRILGGATPQIRGDVEVIDGTGQVIDELRAALAPAAITARANANMRGPRGPAQARTPPDLKLIERPRGTSVDPEKSWLTAGTKEQPRIALIVIQPDAVERSGEKPDFGGYDLYVTNGVNDATESVIYDSVRQALVTTRLRAKGLEMPTIESAMQVPRPNAVVVSAAGKQTQRQGFSRALPFICGLLLFIGVITGGQTLMTSTVEEKSNRIVEVLLAAVSPIELMWGKLLGQLGVGLVVMSIYIGLGVLGLTQFAMLGLLEPQL